MELLLAPPIGDVSRVLPHMNDPLPDDFYARAVANFRDPLPLYTYPGGLVAEAWITRVWVGSDGELRGETDRDWYGLMPVLSATLDYTDPLTGERIGPKLLSFHRRVYDRRAT